MAMVRCFGQTPQSNDNPPGTQLIILRFDKLSIAFNQYGHLFLLEKGLILTVHSSVRGGADVQSRIHNRYDRRDIDCHRLGA